MSVNENIRKLRFKSKKSQQEIADFLEIERKTYINWENGVNDIKSEYIPKLAQFFGVEIQELFRESNSNINITQLHNEGKDNSTFNGAIIILTDKENVNSLLEALQSQLKNK